MPNMLYEAGGVRARCLITDQLTTHPFVTVIALDFSKAFDTVKY